MKRSGPTAKWTTSDGGESFSFSLDTDGAVDDLRLVVAAMNSFLDGTDGEAVIESLAVSDGVIREARCNSSLDQGWVLVDSGATHDLKLLREDELPPRGTKFKLGSWKYGRLDFQTRASIFPVCRYITQCAMTWIAMSSGLMDLRMVSSSMSW